jgi:UDP-N-acetylmuramyl tripeptide synthase
VGGRAILAVDPDALGELSRHRRVALVSGTNGKTTTTTLLRSALATTGPVATNTGGANLRPGLASALADSLPGAPAALEVDEAWLARVVVETTPSIVVLLNLSRDQLDRNNEVRRLAGTWRAIFSGPSAPVVVANADDPLVAWAAAPADEVWWVGAGQPWTADAAGCPSCGGQIRFSSLGGWTCSACPLSRPTLDVRIEGDEVVGAGWRCRPDLRLPGRANRANAAMALTAAWRLGVEPSEAGPAMAATTDVGGRYRTFPVGQRSARLLLAKNPAGWLEILDILRPAPAAVVVSINARIADGRDPSWLWDVPFERLRDRTVVATGERARDVAVRLHYAEVEHQLVPDPLSAIQAAGASDVDVVANYTAFQSLLGRLPGGVR